MIDKSFYQILIEGIDQTAVESVYIFHHMVVIKTMCGVGVSSIGGEGMCPPPKDFGRLAEKNLQELAAYYLSDNYLEVAIGMAAINAHYNHMGPKLVQDFNAHQLIDSKGKNKNVAIIGGFPFIERLKASLPVKNLWVFELKKHYDYHLSPDQYGEYLPQADLVLITGMTLVNKTFHFIYPHLNDGLNVLMGPTVPLCMKLFDYKIGVLAGMLVDDYQKAFKSFSQGAASKYAAGVQKVAFFKE